MDINKLSLQELKALAYDELSKVEIAQKNLQVLNARIFELNKNDSKEESREK